MCRSYVAMQVDPTEAAFDAEIAAGDVVVVREDAYDDLAVLHRRRHAD